jgi:diguanylate cyclase (GGDEF)-like protein
MPIAASMHIEPLFGEFSLRATERAFLEDKGAQTRALLGFTLLFCAVFYLSFAVTDYAALGWCRHFIHLLGVRLVVTATAAACAWLAYRRPLSTGATRLLASLADAVGLACFLLIAALRPEALHWHAMSLAIMLIVIYLYIPNRLVYAMALALPVTAGFMLLAHMLERMSHGDMVTMGMLLLLANAFGALAARRYNLVSREEYRAHGRLLHAAERDHLTGCYNRRYLHERLMGSALADNRRFGACVTVILCDIDKFKRINDTYGHADGDAVIRSFADLMQSITRVGVDSVVRYGGEEFLAVLPGTDLAGGVQVAERMRAAFAATSLPSRCGAGHVATTASFGVACASVGDGGAHPSLSELIAAADELLYEAKRGGRDRVCALEVKREVQAA